MNREIKFRAWDGHRMRYTDYDGKGNDGHALVLDAESWSFYRGAVRFEDRACTGIKGAHLMQFTGLRDKNGKEIYEGDVVRFPLLENRGGHPVVVEWKDAGWNWLNIHYTGGLEVEVIGNIHENPELLTQANNEHS